MKKKFAVLVFLLAVASASFAQLFELAKHEVRIIGGDGAALAPMLSLFEHGKNIGDFAPASGVFGADYAYNVKDRLALGGGFVLSSIHKKPGADGKIDDATNYFNVSVFGLMKIIYFKTELLKFYGAVSLGGGVMISKTGKFGVLPVLQASPFGVRLGTDVVAFFAEVGYGTTGIVNAGLVINIYDN